jgi:predicted nucleotidyltransferase
MLIGEFEKLQTTLLSEIESFYGKRLISVVVFGSVARETQTFRLDILDLLCKKGAYSDVIREAQECVELCLKGMLRFR